MTAGPGAIVAWWEGSGLSFGIVADEAGERVRLLRAHGRDARVPVARIAAIVQGAEQPSASEAALRERAAARLAAVEERLSSQAAEIDVAVLWEIVGEAAATRGEQSVPFEELTELAVGARTGEAAAVTLLALATDGLHFVRRAGGWLPREADAVLALRDERERRTRREGEERDFRQRLAAAVRCGRFEPRGTDAERRYLHALEQLALHAGETPEGERMRAIEALEVSGLAWTREHEGAFRLLRLVGRFASDDENLQVPRFGLRTTFPEAVLERAREVAARGFDRRARRDLTSLEAVSIDGPSTVEIDDLLSIDPRPAGGACVGIHIADPAAFVELDDPVDREALTRGLTYYMPDLRLPMLPPDISERAASLVVGEERPALSFFVELDGDGEVVGFELLRSVVRSARRLTYDEADREIAAGDGALRRLAEVGRLRERARTRAGAIPMRVGEVDVHVDGAGQPVLERIPGESPSRLAVSEAMILAGELAARFCRDADLPAMHRRQAPPAEPPELPADGVWDPVTVRRVRRTLRRAETGLEPGRHAGLGLPAYVQVSSPLRRYQDLVLHRQIVSRLSGKPPCHDAGTLRRIAATTERAESDARRAEDAADEFWLLRYLERVAGRELEGTVVETEPRPIVHLDETLREHVVPGLAGATPGRRVRLVVVRIEPRAGLLSLRPVD